jgi:hypothetical protein
MASTYALNQPLYRMFNEHGGVYCEGCHDSPHAIAPSREAIDAIKFDGWQGHNGPIDQCTVCHATWPSAVGPQRISAPSVTSFSFEPNLASAPEPGSSVVYMHTLHNNGNLADS